ncbi:MAG: peptidase M41 [Methylothermaceae bacteria B42]|nr:MAG: peptidase M41 [Methylothermaceae bacteria B42]
MSVKPEFVDLDAMEARNRRLHLLGNTLKSHFVGIDSVIDELLEAIRIWYLMPQVLTRPLIINLWGMTGVGKTDLIRQLASGLDFQERFVEVELTNADRTSWITSVRAVLNENNLNDSEPKIILFDEIQRFNTIDEEGKPLTNTKFSDFWELLSDGRLSRRDRAEIDYLLAEIIHNERRQRRQKDEDPEEDDDEFGLWNAQKIKQALGLEIPLQDVADLSRPQLITLLQQARTSKQLYEPINHAKTLIFICGNLDDVFSMANMTAEADIDADIYHAFTKKITLVDIKRSLSRRFKPEQVARFGNIHIIYRSLRRADFEALIQQEIHRIRKRTGDLFGIDLRIDSTVADLIYRNGVFPVQGVRPVFSTVADVLETHLAQLLFHALTHDSTQLDLEYNQEKQCLRAIFDGKNTTEIPYTGRLDHIRQSTSPDLLANTSVHEAGHAVAYGVLFKMAPLQLTARVASSETAGFTFPHQIYDTANHLLYRIQVLLAGGAAEELIFGHGNASGGRLSDHEQATKLAMDYVRRYGFDEEFHANYALTHEYAMDMTVTDTDIEKMLTRLKSEAQKILSENEDLLLDLSRTLVTKGVLHAEEVAAIAAEHGLKLEVKPEGYIYTPGYASRLQEKK